MATYSYALFAHILGVTGLFIAMSLQLASMIGILRSRTVEQVRVWCGMHTVLLRIFALSFVLTLGAGMHMTFTIWGWSTAWINASLAGLLILTGLGPLINTRRLKVLHREALALPEGPVPTSLRRRIQDPILWSSVLGMNAMAVGSIYLMVLKPGLLETWLVMVGSILLGMGAGCILTLKKRSTMIETTQPAEA
ncbi:hypothetical protein [Ktedonobacter robiniae]|uniref:DUF2269 domain-containing protein n=1 Tax=Ktedonobacter robiniae TaxID=2778365 RepID=A0ABQ3V0Y4_9CHLR|nr:hypothetical protein [Ktedonobacter robiniae]GHO58597.1 hypothetical protein KSB_70720 [Ktedonobacter robiniae]